MGRLCTCGGCGEHFATLAAFDEHRAGPSTRHGRHCLTSKQMQARNLHKDKNGVWTQLLAHPLPGKWEAAASS